MTRAYYDSKPSAFEAVGNGNYLYRWDIQEELIERGEEMYSVTQYSCYEVTISGDPTYEKCVGAVIRSQYSEDEELAMINKFNSYHNNIIEDDSIVDEYKAYLQFVADTKSQVKSVLGIGFNL